MMDARTITKTLGGRWYGAYGLARCPAHCDREPSLKVRDDPRKNDGIDLHCFAGCTWQDVKAELTRQGLIDEWMPPPLIDANSLLTDDRQSLLTPPTMTTTI
jgi:hypothetical protein